MLVVSQEQRHKRVYKRWACEVPMHLWQLDWVGGLHLAGGRERKILTGIDDRSRFVVVAAALEQPSGAAVREAFIAAMARWGVPFEVLTDNGKQFTGRFTKPLPAEVLFERTCREYGITARLTKRRSPTTTGKIERFPRTLRRELLDEVGAFATIEAAQSAVDEWVYASNTSRPHQALDMATPASVFRPRPVRAPQPSAESTPLDAPAKPPRPANRAVEVNALELDLRVPQGGIVDLGGTQQVWVGKSYAGRAVTLWVDATTVHVLLEDQVVKTVASRLSTADFERLHHARGTPGPGLPGPEGPEAGRPRPGARARRD